MSKETLEDLKAIIAGKPGGAKSISEHVNAYVKRHDGNFYWWDGECWQKLHCHIETRSLSDIERIIELKEQVKAGYEAYARIEEVKQRYNAENKQLKEALKGLLQLTAGSPDGYWRNELNAARKALGLKV